MTREQWEAEAKRVVDGYLERKDGHFDDTMCAHFHSCDFEEQSISIEFATQPWQRNERDGIHGGAIAGMFDTACGVVPILRRPMQRPPLKCMCPMCARWNWDSMPS